ncbi:MAG: type II secretion system F family protein [Thermoplasmatota archaeon]
MFSKKDDNEPNLPPELAGVVKQRTADAFTIFKRTVYAITGAAALVFFLVGAITLTGASPIPDQYATDAIVVALILAAGPWGFFYLKEMKRREAIDERFPDFLRDLSESARAGMTLPRALVTAASGNYGALTPEIKKMAAQVDWGISFGDALHGFAERTKTDMIRRSVNLVTEAQKAGGNMVEVLSAAGNDVREIKQIIQERNQQMASYSMVIYIAYFVFIAVVMVLVTQFIPAFKEVVGDTEPGAQVGGIQFRDFDPEDFQTLFFQACVVQAIGGGLVSGVLTRGSPVAGLRSIIIMIAIAWIAFRVVV